MFTSSLESIGAWRAQRLPLARFVPLAVLIAWAAGGSTVATARGLALIGLALSLIAQCRLWDDLVDRDRDRSAHPERLLAARGPIDVYVNAVIGLGAVNAVALAHACIRRIADDDLTGLDLQCWKVAYCGAEPVQADTLERFAARFERCGFRAQALRPVYGLAEATLLVAASDPAASRPRVRRARRHDLESGRFVAAPGGTALVSCGRPQPGTRIAIVDPVSARALPEGSSGEIWVSGPALADGYWRREHDADSFRWAEVDGIGARWFCTGDLGLLLDGELYVSGRRKDLIILRGRKLHPQDIEHTVHALLASRLDAVAAFALQKSEGEGVVVLAELRHGMPADEPASLADRIRSHVYRCHEIAMDALGFVRPGSLARTSSGKLMRFRCRQDFIESRLRLIARFDTPASGLALAMRSA